MANSTINSLDLYAKVEDLLGVKESAPKLYAHYLLFLQTIAFESLLDVGCGSGDFLRQVGDALDIPKRKGIDLSPLMVQQTLNQGIEAEVIDLCELNGTYDVITAVFDMVNYLDTNNLERFLHCVANHLHPNGYFLCDINTLYGFENVAVGSFIVDDEDRFVTVDSEFEEGVYHSEFTLFEKKRDHFIKSQEKITQYYHSVEEIVKRSGFTLVKQDEVNLYGFDEADKMFLVLKK